MKKESEADIQRVCLDWLRLFGAVVIRVNSAAKVIPATETTKRRFLKANDQPGCSDALVCLQGGLFAAIEFKAPGKRATSEQTEFLDRVRELDGLAIVVHSLDELKLALAAEGYKVEL